MNFKNIKFPIRKLVYSLIIALFSSFLVSFSSVFAFSFSWFLILFVVYFFMTQSLETKDYIFYYFIRTIKSLFFFLPISAIFYSISLTFTMVSSTTDDLSAWATAVWGTLWSFVVVFICLVIWLVWWLIIWTFAKEPKQEQNTWRSIGILFLVIITLSIFYLSQVSTVEKEILTDTNIEKQ
jgi:hypothetical protein